ncbi:replication initiator protein A [Lentilactobacillus parakefiri]|uniref:MarR family transcriptional regulator n=1 Tax=Lentilactobacillus parakefiri TaxID=152332 RepID=UPI000BA56FB4|nr:MarR family transcriptional regulator [Lentilactobacillus parakefiri]PAK99540.1 replication initiator protein A [Lentilactobacillus parakefiri]
MKQFFKVKESNLNSDLKGGNEILIYSLLEDRMQASTKNKDFFSKKFNDYYVIYTRDELAMKLGVNVSTITEVFKRLEKKGYLVMKHQFNGATKLFLPKFENETSPEANHDNVKREIQRPEIGKPNSSRTLNSNNKQTKDTRDTCSETNSKIVAITQKEKQVAKQKKLNELEINALSNSLETKAGFSKRTVNMLKALSFNDPKKLYQLSSLVFKSKNVVKKQSRNVMNSQLALSFEINDRYENMAVDIQRIVMTANRRKRRNVEGYIFSSLINYFQEAVNDYCSRDIQSVL